MKTLIFILTLLSCVYCQAQNRPNANQGGTTAKNYLTEVPYEMVNGKILISVELGGKKRKFLFDTGAPTTISASLAKELKATRLGKVSAEDISGKSDSLSFVKLDGLKLGDVTFSGIPALVTVPEFIDCFQAEGFIGSNLLRNSVLGIQTLKHVLVITDQPEKFMVDKKYAVPMLVDSMQSDPQIAVSFNGLSGTIPFDTGMSNFMSFREEWITALQNNHITFEETDKGFGSNVIGAFGHQPNEEKHRLKFPAVQIGNARFENVYTETTKDGKPIIGTRILEYGNIILDYINKQYYFFPKTATAINMEEKHWPFGVTPKDGKLVITMTWSKGKDLFKLGEQVLSINGKDFTHADICDLVTNGSLLTKKDIMTATLVIKDAKGKKRTITIQKE